MSNHAGHNIRTQIASIGQHSPDVLPWGLDRCGEKPLQCVSKSRNQAARSGAVIAPVGILMTSWQSPDKLALAVE